MSINWYRTCQECGHEQVAKEPPRDKELTDSYRNFKCRKCKSESLDYGTMKTDDNSYYEELGELNWNLQRNG